jgi:hypothetical protein
MHTFVQMLRGGNLKKKDDYSLPISTYEEYLKNLDYMTYGIITYFSNRTMSNEEGDSGELFRWVYKNKLIENQDEIEKLSKNKFNTVMRNVRKLSKMDNNLVVAKNSENGIVYYINYYHMPHGKFVTIHHEILKYLLTVSNSNVIKTYVFLKYRCSKGKTRVTRKEMAEAIGLSPNSESNLTTISDITTMLDGILIKKSYEYITTVDEKTGNEYSKRYCYYSLIDEDLVLEKIKEGRKSGN